MSLILSKEHNMDTQYFSNFAKQIRQFDGSCEQILALRISQGPSGLETFYSPFEYINPNAQIIICGVTPGLQQASVALKVLKENLLKSVNPTEALKAAKNSASFAGSMRNNITRLFDYIGITRYLGLTSSASLFGDDRSLVHYTSALRFPILKNGKNYSGDQAMTNQDYLWGQAKLYLSEEALVLPNALWVPLGDSVASVLLKLVEEGVLREEQVLSGLPHPSGANSERIKYFIGEKPREALSQKTNPDKLDLARTIIKKKIDCLAS